MKFFSHQYSIYSKVKMQYPKNKWYSNFGSEMTTWWRGARVFKVVQSWSRSLWMFSRWQRKWTCVVILNLKNCSNTETVTFGFMDVWRSENNFENGWQRSVHPFSCNRFHSALWRNTQESLRVSRREAFTLDKVYTAKITWNLLGRFNKSGRVGEKISWSNCCKMGRKFWALYGNLSCFCICALLVELSVGK